MAPGERASPGRAAALLIGYALLHSLLTSRQAKDLARRAFGERVRNGLYRPFFMAQAIVTFAGAVLLFLRLPDRTLYRVPPPWSWLMCAGQVVSLGIATAAALGVGIEKITGLEPLWRFARGDDPPPEPEAQGPRLAENGEMAAVGIFRHTRHPANWGFMPLIPLLPHMTVNRAIVGVLTVIYLVLGSLHEEIRLRGRYGDAPYSRYREKVPFLIGRRSLT